jgi:hypothetical protein
MSLVDTAIAKMQNLPPERQQEIIDFIDFLLSRGPWVRLTNGESSELQRDEQLEPVTSAHGEVSVFEAAGDLIGCVEGPSDLSMSGTCLSSIGTAHG